MNLIGFEVHFTKMGTTVYFPGLSFQCEVCKDTVMKLYFGGNIMFLVIDLITDTLGVAITHTGAVATLM